MIKQFAIAITLAYCHIKRALSCLGFSIVYSIDFIGIVLHVLHSTANSRTPFLAMVIL